MEDKESIINTLRNGRIPQAAVERDMLWLTIQNTTIGIFRGIKATAYSESVHKTGQTTKFS